MSTGAPASPLDYLDLALLRLAKSKRTQRMDSASDAVFYEEFFTDLDESVLGEGHDPRKAARLGAVVNALLRHVPGGSVLDVGCGIGDALSRYCDAGVWSVWGVEYAHASAARAARRLGSRATVRTGSAADLPFDDASFDGVTCIEVLEHIEDESGALSELRRVLRPNGRAIITVPYRHWFPEYRELMGHHRHYTQTEFRRRLQHSGFRIVEWLPNWPVWHRTADLIYIAARVLSEVISRARKRSIRPHELVAPFGRLPLLSAGIGAIDHIKRSEERSGFQRRSTTTSCVVAR